MSVIDISPDVMSGAPVFSETRVPVQTLFDYLKGGDSIDDFLDGFPTVTKEQVISLLDDSFRTVAFLSQSSSFHSKR